jgi:tetratricopeptide (TPR) repeat protein
VALVLVAAAVAFGAMPLLADAWMWHGRSDLATVVDPLQAQYRWTWGQTLAARGDLAGGVAQLQLAADFGETEPALYVELGDKQMQLGRRAQALASYRRALAIDPYYAAAKQRLAANGANAG